MSVEETQAQREIFEIFFNATGGQDWRHKDNWEKYLGKEASADKIYGVTVSSQGLAIVFDDNGLSGIIRFTYCSVSRVMNVVVSGKIPGEIGKLANLWKLKLNKCAFTGKNTFLVLDNCVRAYIHTYIHTYINRPQRSS